MGAVRCAGALGDGALGESFPPQPTATTARVTTHAPTYCFQSFTRSSTSSTPAFHWRRPAAAALGPARFEHDDAALTDPHARSARVLQDLRDTPEDVGV